MKTWVNVLIAVIIIGIIAALAWFFLLQTRETKKENATGGNRTRNVGSVRRSGPLRPVNFFRNDMDKGTRTHVSEM